MGDHGEGYLCLKPHGIQLNFVDHVVDHILLHVMHSSDCGLYKGPLPYGLDRGALRDSCEDTVELPVLRSDSSYVVFDGGGVEVEFLAAGELHTVALSRPS